jgi:hypothetical protein
MHEIMIVNFEGSAQSVKLRQMVSVKDQCCMLQHVIRVEQNVVKSSHLWCDKILHILFAAMFSTPLFVS